METWVLPDGSGKACEAAGGVTADLYLHHTAL